MSSLLRKYKRAYKRRQNDWMEEMRRAAVKNGTTNMGAGTGLKRRKGPKNSVENLGQGKRIGAGGMVAQMPIPQRKGDK